MGLNIHCKSIQILQKSTKKEIKNHLKPHHSEITYINILVDMLLDLALNTIDTCIISNKFFP